MDMSNQAAFERNAILRRPTLQELASTPFPDAHFHSLIFQIRSPKGKSYLGTYNRLPDQTTLTLGALEAPSPGELEYMEHMTYHPLDGYLDTRRIMGMPESTLHLDSNLTQEALATHLGKVAARGIAIEVMSAWYADVPKARIDSSPYKDRIHADSELI